MPPLLFAHLEGLFAQMSQAFDAYRQVSAGKRMGGQQPFIESQRLANLILQHLEAEAAFLQRKLQAIESVRQQAYGVLDALREAGEGEPLRIIHHGKM